MQVTRMSPKNLLWAVAVLGSAASCSSAPPRSPNQAVASAMTLCDVLNQRQRFHLSRVRVEAILASGYENTWLYHPACHGEGLRTTVEFPTSQEAKLQGLSNLLDDTLAKDRRAWVVVEGVFHGPQVAAVDPKLPQALRDALEAQPIQVRYGHLNAYETMLKVARIDKVLRVASETPW